MKFFLRLVLLGLCAFPLASAAVAADARSLAAAETAFAQESVAKGMKTAFLDVLSDKGIVFQPGPQNGKKAWGAAKESSSELSWQPTLAVVAASGDLGYTTGPWSYKKEKSDASASAFGQFVSIWRQENGQWKLLFDLGLTNPKPTEPASQLRKVDLKLPNDANFSPEPKELFARDRAFLAGAPKTMETMVAPDIRVLREPDAPTPTRYGEPMGGVSSAGDLGYVWGQYTGGNGGGYLHIWRRDAGGEWKLVLDLLHPR